MNKKILYIGNFYFPDKNAASHRVLNNAKILRQLGYEVEFITSNRDYKNNPYKETMVEGFKIYQEQRPNTKSLIFFSMFSSQTVENYIKKNKNLVLVIAYNYDAIALLRILLLCRKHKIKCIGDVADWYGARGNSFLAKLIFSFDTTLRMRFIHQKLDGLIVISDFLKNYYKDKLIVQLPPLVDINSPKWNINVQRSKTIQLIYAGTPSREKERLDSIVDAVNFVSNYFSVNLKIFGITKQQFCNIYNYKSNISPCIIFLGRITHDEVLRNIKQAHFSIIVRDSNRVVNTGFPTKLVESISCGTPVITNLHYNVLDTETGNNYYLLNIQDINTSLLDILKKQNHTIVDRNIFYYKNYTQKFYSFLTKLGL